MALYLHCSKSVKSHQGGHDAAALGNSLFLQRDAARAGLGSFLLFLHLLFLFVGFGCSMLRFFLLFIRHGVYLLIRLYMISTVIDQSYAGADPAFEDNSIVSNSLVYY
jgi:hypothetical protein